MRSEILAPLLSFFLGFAVVACADAARRGDVELPTPHTIRGDKLHKLLPPDGIPAIDEPQFVPADEARFMRDEEPVIGVRLNGQAKAYSLWHLERHEVVNDRFGRDPVAVTW